MFDAFGPFWGKYLEAISSGSIGFVLAMFPIFVLISVLWYFFAPTEANRTGKRTAKRAFQEAFPVEDFKIACTKADIYNLFILNLVGRPLRYLTLTIPGTIISAVLFLEIFIYWFGEAPALVTSPAAVIALQLLMLIIASELASYVYHILSHKVDFLWSFHRVHHSAEKLSFLAGTARNNPLDGWLTWPVELPIKGLIMGATLYVTNPVIHPAALGILVGLEFIFSLGGLLRHNRARISFGPLNYIFNAPALHQIHHSMELHHRDKNFGANLSIFDWMFGTLYIPSKDESWRYGLNEEEVGATNPHVRLRDYYLEPLYYAAASLSKTFRGVGRLFRWNSRAVSPMSNK